MDLILHEHRPFLSAEGVTCFMDRVRENNGAARIVLEIDLLRTSMSLDSDSGSQDAVSMEVVLAGESDTQNGHTSDSNMMAVSTWTSDDGASNE